MRIITIVLFALLMGCSKESDPECYLCVAKTYSNQAQVCGFANNGNELIDETILGEFCDFGNITALKNQYNSVRYLNACGGTYRLETRVQCD